MTTITITVMDTGMVITTMRPSITCEPSRFRSG
jgi:hypothetical protein